MHNCTQKDSEFKICNKCGQKYKDWQGHICPTVIKWISCTYYNNNWKSV